MICSGQWKQFIAHSLHWAMLLSLSAPASHMFHPILLSGCSFPPLSLPQQLQVKEFYLKFIPYRLYTCKVCPSTNVSHRELFTNTRLVCLISLSTFMVNIFCALTFPSLPFLLPPPPSPPPSLPTQVHLHPEPGMFSLDDGYQVPIALQSPHREVIAATFYKFVLKNIGKRCVALLK